MPAGTRWRDMRRITCPDGHQVCIKCDKTLPDQDYSINRRTGQLTKTCTGCLSKRRIVSSVRRPYSPKARSTKNIDIYLRQFLAIRVCVDRAK